MTQARRFAQNGPKLPTLDTNPRVATGSASPVATFELVDFLQLAGLSRRSIVIAVKDTESGMGTVEIVSGDVWNASVGNLTGMEAMSFLIGGKVPVLAVEPMCYQPETRQITVSITGLLLELAKKRDEKRFEDEQRQKRNEGGPADRSATLGRSGNAAENTAENTARSYRAACASVHQTLPSSCGLILIDLAKKEALTVAHPRHGDWVDFSTEVAEIITALIDSLQRRKLDFGTSTTNPPSSEEVTKSQQIQQAYLATACCHYFITRVPREPTLALALVTDATISQGEGWVSLRSSLARIVQGSPAAPTDRTSSSDENSLTEQSDTPKSSPFRRSAAQ